MKQYKNAKVTIQSYIRYYEYKQTCISPQNEPIYKGREAR